MINNIPKDFQKDYVEFKKKLDDFVNNNEQYNLPVRNGIKKDILFLGGTHGDEKIGVEALQTLETSSKFDWLLANEQASEQNKRFIDVDMNRCAPGDLNSAKYEEKKVAEIVKQFKNYNYVIDIHGTKANSGLFIILTKLSFEDLLLALQFDIPNIVIWVPSEKKPTGPLVEFAEPGIEIECGPKDDENIKNKLIAKLKNFLIRYNSPITKENLVGKKIFFVNGKIDNSSEKLIDFELTKTDNEEFYPLLVGSYGISCYKMVRIFLF